MEKIYDMLVIGGGPGGLTAALYGARAGLEVLVLEGRLPGGQMALTAKIDNYPGFPDGIDGFTLARQMREGAVRFGAEIRAASAQSLALSGDVKKAATGEKTCLGRTVVIATGADPRRLGLPGEEELVGRGVSYCASCDAAFYRGKTVAVVGGGNTAAGDAEILARLCEKVYLVHRRNSLRADKLLADSLKKTENVEFLWNHTVTALRHGEMLSGIRVREIYTGAEREIPCDGLFVAIGQEPNSGLCRGELASDVHGYLPGIRTEIPGVFTAGDVRAKAVRQVVTAAADGAEAAHFAMEFLRTQNGKNRCIP